MSSLTIENLLQRTGERLELKILSGTGERLRREINKATVGKTTPLAHGRPGEIIILSKDSFLSISNPSQAKKEALSAATDLSGVPCLVISEEACADDGRIEFLRSLPVAVLSSSLEESVIESRLSGILRETLCAERSLCGVLVTISGRGVFIRGESGSGKSRCALELIGRGGRMVSDDVVELRRTDGRSLKGRSPVATRDLLALKGVGIANIRHLLGDDALIDEGGVDLIVELTDDGGTREGEREAFQELLGVTLPLYRLPANDPLQAAKAIADMSLGISDPDNGMGSDQAWGTRAVDIRQGNHALRTGFMADGNVRRHDRQEGPGI